MTMIRKTLLAAFLLAATITQAQDTTATSTVDSALLTMPKVQLAEIFLKEVTRVTERISTLPLDTTGGDVPPCNFTSSKFTKVGAKAGSYGKALVEHYTVIIPYADRSEIIRCIQYLRQIP
jgi:hypothetical protein